MNLLHQSVSGPHIDLFDADRQVSARLGDESALAQESAKAMVDAESRLGRLLLYSPLPENELEKIMDGTSISSFSGSSRCPSRPVSRASSNRYALEKTKDPLEISDEAMEKLLGFPDSNRPVSDIISGEDDKLSIMIRAEKRERMAQQSAGQSTKRGSLKRKDDSRVSASVREQTPKIKTIK